MKHTSKYLGQEFDGFVVEDVFLAKSYNKSYKEHTKVPHNYYKAVIYNKQLNLSLTISANLLRPLLKGEKKMSDVLSTKPHNGGRNSEIVDYRRLVKVQNGN